MALKSQENEQTSNVSIREMETAFELYITESTNTVVKTVQSESKHIIEAVKVEIREQSEKINELSIDVNYCTQATDKMKETVVETVAPMCQDATTRAKSSEQTTRLLLGLLGSQERKRRKVDTDEISRLRNEIGVMKRQSRDKDAQYTEMIGTLSDRVEELLCQMEDMRAENNSNQEKILALLAARL